MKPRIRKRKTIYASAALEKRREEEAASGSMEEEDRFYQLPDHVLEHIISFLPQEDAVRTCVLSKSWRHLGPTRPKIEFHESSYPKKEQQQLFVKNTLQRYLDQKLSVREFILVMSSSGSGFHYFSLQFLNEWIPKVIMNMGAKTFKLKAHNFSLPPVVFESKILEELYLKRCTLHQINNNVNLHTLKLLSLRSVYIDDGTFEKILSSCPSIEHLGLDVCKGLNTTKVNKARNLKLYYYRMRRDRIGIVEIDDNAPGSLETIHIEGSLQPWCHLHNNNTYFFPRLKSLKLWHVHLTTELLNNLSSSKNCPSLEDLQLHYCSGFTEFKLSHRSIKRLIVRINDRPIKAAIDATSMLYFEYRDGYVPSISFATTTSRECKSRVYVQLRESCPSIEHLVLDLCNGLNTSFVNKARNIKHYYYRMSTNSIGSIEIDVDAPDSLETIHIEGGLVQPWYHLHNNNNYFFPLLKSLCLRNVHLPTELLNNLSSSNCPCLEKLVLEYCSGFKEFKLSNRSIKSLIIKINDRPIKAAIDAANMLHFEYTSCYLPSISFATTTSRECKSRVEVWPCLDSTVDDLLTWSRKLLELMKALSQTRISLDTCYLPLTNCDGGGCEPVVVEHLWLREDLLNCLFCTYRPRYLYLFLCATSSQRRYEMAESIRKALVRKGKTRHSQFWKKDLEESSIQVLDKNTKEWRSVQECALPKNENFRFRLKWKTDN